MDRRQKLSDGREMKVSRKKWAALAAGVVTLLVAFMLAKFVFPLEIAGWESRRSLKSAGVKEWQSAQTSEAARLTGWEQNYCASSEGCECIALVHGLGDDALTWRKVLMRPADKWFRHVHLIAVDLPGSGETPRPIKNEDYRARTLGARVADSLRGVSSCKSWTIVGNSFGGWVSSWAAISWPEGIKKLVLVDSAGLKPADGESTGAKLLSQPTEESLKEFQAKAYYSPRPLPEAVWKAAAKRAAHGNSRDVVAAQVPDDFLDTHASELRIPAILLWGAADKIVSPERGRALGALIKGAQFREAPKCGHMPQKECPEVLVGVIQEMLRFGAM